MNEPQRNRTNDDTDRRANESVPPLDKDPPPGKLPSDAGVQAERQPESSGESAS